MAHTLDTSGSFTESNANPYTGNLVCNSASTVLIVAISNLSATTRAGGAPTYYGKTLTQVPGSPQLYSSGGEVTSELWYLYDPPHTAAYQLSVPNTNSDTLMVRYASFKAATGKKSRLDFSSGSTGASANPSFSGTPALAGDVLFSVLGSGYRSLPTAYSHTSLAPVDHGNWVSVAQYYLSPNTSAITMTYTTPADDWSMVWAAFKELTIGVLQTIVASGIQTFTPKYGYLYNMWAKDDSRLIYASGWHIPSDAEYDAFYTFLGGFWGADKLKTVGLEYWIDPNTGTNEYGFNARGSGVRGSTDGSFLYLKEWMELWSSTSNWLFSITNNYLSNPSRDNVHGASVRVVKDSTTLSEGQTGMYVGNDGKIYPTVCINGVEWLAANLCETRFRDGSIIPYYGANSINYTNAEWIALASSARCAYNNDENNAAMQDTSVSAFATLWKRASIAAAINSGQITGINVYYGALYNWWAFNNSDNLANTGWHIATTDEYITMYSSLGVGFEYTYYPLAGNNGGALTKEPGSTYWDSDSGVSNSAKLNVRGAGYRDSDGSFTAIKQVCYPWSYTDAAGGYVFTYHFSSNAISSAGKYTGGFLKRGLPVRLVKDSTSLSHGQSGTYTGNDGKIYRTICINGVEWLADNLCETQFRTKAAIPLVTGNSEWAALSTAGMCWYNNNQGTNGYSTSAIDIVQGLLTKVANLRAQINSGFGKYKTPRFGTLYNFEAITYDTGGAGICPPGCHLPSRTEYETLKTFAGNSANACREVSSEYWFNDTSATNSSGFSARGNGRRLPDGSFQMNRAQSYYYTSTLVSTSAWVVVFAANSDTFGIYYYSPVEGYGLRLLKDSTTDMSPVMDYDGNFYTCVKIGDQIWLREPFICTHYNDGTLIPLITDNSEWANTTEGAMAYYDNDSTVAFDLTPGDSVIGTLTFTEEEITLIASILTESGITAVLTGNGKLISNLDGSTTLLAQVSDGGFIPVIIFF